MRSTIEALEGNKVKLTVEVDEAEFEPALDAAFKKISQEVRIPGFRPGKVPRRIIEARIGAEAARHEALRSSLPEYYVAALKETDTDAIAQPEIQITAGEESGDIAFDAVVEVRPVVAIPGYQSLEVTVPTPAVTEEDVDAQIERMRTSDADLVEVDRPAQDGDVLLIDFTATAGDEVLDDLRGYSCELGSSAGFPPEVHDHLRGARVGDVIEFSTEMGDRTIDVRIVVNRLHEKVLPDATDEWAQEASEFETLADLRADVRRRVVVVNQMRTRLAIRDAAVEALAGLVDADPPDALVNTEVERQLQDLGHRVQNEGLELDAYLAETGQTAEDLVAQLRETSARAVSADLALRALADAEDLEVTDEDVDTHIERLASRLSRTPRQLRQQLERDGQVQAVRSDVRKTKAVEWLIEHVDLVDLEGQPIDRALLAPPEPDVPEQQPVTENIEEQQA
jgi:trigger factor